MLSNKCADAPARVGVYAKSAVSVASKSGERAEAGFGHVVRVIGSALFSVQRRRWALVCALVRPLWRVC